MGSKSNWLEKDGEQVRSMKNKTEIKKPGENDKGSLKILHLDGIGRLY